MAERIELNGQRERLNSGEYERVILGNILLDQELLNGEPVARLKAEDFSLSSYSLIFRRIHDLVRAGEQVDLGPWRRPCTFVESWSGLAAGVLGCPFRPI